MTAPRACAAPAERERLEPGTPAWSAHLARCLACQVQERILADMELRPAPVPPEMRLRHLAALRRRLVKG